LETTMKIDRQYITPDTRPDTAPDTALDARPVRRSASAPARERTPGKGMSPDAVSPERADTVDLSGAVSTRHIVSRAVEAALNGPDGVHGSVPDGTLHAVERAKALYASGELGQDHDALANAIISSLIEQS
jgi:hypothetical protein